MSSRPQTTDPIQVHFFTLTDVTGSEHLYLQSLREALTDREIVAVDDWRAADVVHLFEVNLFTRATLSAFEFPRLARILASETPVVVSTDDLYFTGDPELTVRPELYWPNHYAQRGLFAAVDRIIAISESVSTALARSVAADKIQVVRHGVADAYRVESVTNPIESAANDSELDVTAAELDANDAESEADRDPFVLHVSLASPRKNPEAVVELVRQLDVPFKIAGSGWEERIPSTPAFENVETLGYVPESELIDLYKRAAVFYFPTRHEGFGLPILEAMAAGCAVVTSDVYSVPEVAGDAAVCCRPEDVETHLRTVTKLIENESRREQLAERAIERAADFTWEGAAAETEAVYRQVLSEIAEATSP